MAWNMLFGRNLPASDQRLLVEELLTTTTEQPILDGFQTTVRRSNRPLRIALFDRVCEMDLEGIVAKHKFGPYVIERETST